MSYFKAKMHQIRSRLGLCLDFAGGAHSTPPDPLPRFEGSYFQGKKKKGKEERGKERKGKMQEEKEKEKDKKRGKKREGQPPEQRFWLRCCLLLKLCHATLVCLYC